MASYDYSSNSYGNGQNSAGYSQGQNPNYQGQYGGNGSTGQYGGNGYNPYNNGRTVCASPDPAASLPPQYRPLSAWAYFGYTLLFTIPLVGFILLIVYSFDESNINRRNYARSYWCALLVAIILAVVVLVIMLLFGRSLDRALR